MTMQYNPDEMIEHIPVEEGDYEFSVVNANEATSKNGNDMIELELQCEVGRDKPITVFDRLVNTPGSLWVVKDFCNAVAPRLNFDAGELEAANCIGLTGKAHLLLGAENNKGRRYMEVACYVQRSDGSHEPSTASVSATQTEESVHPTASEAEGPKEVPF